MPGDRPTAAFILSLVGGLIILVTGVLVGVIFLVVGTYLGGPPFLSVFWGLLGILIGIPVIIGAVMMYVNPKNHVAWGVAVIVFSLASYITASLGGFLIGLLLGLIGGILGAIWNPPSISTSFPVTKACLNCGRVMNEDAKYCSNCGKPFA
ncbi:MAG TPA: DUF6114 domain-containing protein [Candidatus Bathyarchaeia archaeon]|nr:DUF6114 domain-containing protein [Candidatus Bathyarchaeia archaeon]